jgi:ribosomal protein S18
MSEQTEKPRETQSMTPLEMSIVDAHIIQRHTTDTGKLLPRKNTRLTAKQQRHITRVIKQARNVLIMQ